MELIHSGLESYTLRILVTDECPARCVGCHNEFQVEGNKSKDRFVSIGMVDNLLSKLKTIDYLPGEVVLSGGEPSLFEGLGELAALVKEKGVKVLSLNSNCVGWDNILKSIKWLDEVKVHIEDLPHTNNPSAYVESIGLSNKVLENIKCLPSLLNPNQLKKVNTIMRSKDQVMRVISFCQEYHFDTKLIEESLITIQDVSYSLEECIKDLEVLGYVNVTKNDNPFHEMYNSDLDHTVELRQCLSIAEPIISFDNRGIVKVNYLGDSPWALEYTIEEFVETAKARIKFFTNLGP